MQNGKSLSERHKRAIALGHIGKSSGMLGKTHSIETRRKMSTIMKANLPVKAFKKGAIPWNKGISCNAGKDHPNWKGGISPHDKSQRSKFGKTMQSTVFERDDYTCQICGLRGVDLQVDHIQPWKDYVELRFSMDNCRTLCAKCHYKITFGREMPKDVKGWGHHLLKGGVLT